VAAAILECEPSISTNGHIDLRKRADDIRNEYLGLPGLSLTMAQAQRLWSLDCDTCQGLLDVMVREKFLKRTADAQYVRADRGRASDARD
jgi:hypothetical protein